MAHVFLTVVAVDYEGEDVLAVSSARERALVAFRDRCADPDNRARMDCHHDRHWVERWEIDGKAEFEEVFSDTIEDAWARAPESGGEGDEGGGA